MNWIKNKMDYKLAKQLKDAGFPQNTQFYFRLGYSVSEHFEHGVSQGKEGHFSDYELRYYPKPRYTTADVKWNQTDLSKIEQTEIACPTLSELIEACGDEFYSLVQVTLGEWNSFSTIDEGNTILTIKGKTPEEAVAKLWLELNKK